MPKEKDIFDKMMGWPILRIFEPFYKKYKEALLYLFFGGLAFIVSVASFSVLVVTLQMNSLVANIISWILAVTFAFFTNRIWVFASPTNGAKEFLLQMFHFFSGRVATLLVEEAILLIFVTILQFNSIVIKVIAQIVVIILNYIISKLFVFKNKDKR